MYKFYLFTLVFVLAISVTAQVGIGTTTPSVASMLEVSSSSDGINFKGLMPPRITSITNRDAIAATTSDIGLIIFLADAATGDYCLQVWSGAAWESIYCISAAVTGSVVSFASNSSFSQEDAGGVDLLLNIANPSPTNSISVIIAANDYSNLDESVAQMVVIPANTAFYSANNIFNITDDLDVELSEDVTFTITSVTGGLPTTSIGTNNTHVLTITDNDGVFTGVAQDFDLLNTWAYNSDVLFFDNGTDGFYGIDDGTQMANLTTMSNNFIGCEDLNDEGNGTTGFATLTFATITVAGVSGVQLSFDYEVFEVDTNDDIYYTVTLDGVDEPEVFLVDGITNLSENGTLTIPIPDGTNTVGFRIRFRQNGLDEMGFDNFRLE